MLFLLFLLLLFHPTCFPARTTPLATTVNHHSSTWDKSEMKKYMQRFGYFMLTGNTTSSSSEELEFKFAVTRYQRKMGLTVTGNIDSQTISQMKLPRCGVSDTNLHADALHVRHYNYFTGKPRWSRAIPTTLTYAFSPNCMDSNLNLSDIRLVFRRAFSRWSAVIPVNFTETEDYGFSDIKIGFYSGDHEDGEPFDGVLGILAHGFSPESGKLHLDAAETWAVDFESEKSRVAVDLESVATHEIGHVLGLAHSFVKESVMYPSLKPRERKMELKVDDVEGIQQLYGSNPNYNMEALCQADTSSSQGIDSKMKRSITFTIAMLLILIC